MKHIIKKYFDLNKIYLRQINILIILKLKINIIII